MISTKLLIAASVIVDLGGALPASGSNKGVSKAASRALYPFSRMVAFGDNLSDNGNGSFAHCLADQNNCKDKIYGYGTWTNGPVAVSYLADLLAIPLTTDYAFGGADGGSKIGATINNSYTSSMYAPDAFEQVAQYTSTDGLKSTIGDTLHFLWIGNNDITLKHISTTQAKNPAFANAMADQMEELVQRLVDKGANYIFVPAIYPKHVAPFRQFLASDKTQIANLGRAISQANNAIQQRLSSTFGKTVIYHDAFNFLLDVYNNNDDYGIKYVLPDFCDGYSQKDWNLCVTQGKGSQFYWMQYTDMTTYVHSLLATDMAQVIIENFGKKTRNGRE